MGNARLNYYYVTAKLNWFEGLEFGFRRVWGIGLGLRLGMQYGLGMRYGLGWGLGIGDRIGFCIGT